MAKLTLADVTNILGNPTSAANTINNNNTLIETALENTLSRDGSTPNLMNSDIDLNNNDVLNVGTLDADRLMLDGVLIQPGDPTTDALLISNALSELADNNLDDEARVNLGLGTAATHDADEFLFSDTLIKDSGHTFVWGNRFFGEAWDGVSDFQSMFLQNQPTFLTNGSLGAIYGQRLNTYAGGATSDSVTPTCSAVRGYNQIGGNVTYCNENGGLFVTDNFSWLGQAVGVFGQANSRHGGRTFGLEAEAIEHPETYTPANGTTVLVVPNNFVASAVVVVKNGVVLATPAGYTVTAKPASDQTGTITSISGTGTVVTVAFTGGFTPPVDYHVDIAGVTPNVYNGRWRVITSGVGTATLAAPGTGAMTVAGTLQVFTALAGSVTLTTPANGTDVFSVIRGDPQYAASGAEIIVYAAGGTDNNNPISGNRVGLSIFGWRNGGGAVPTRIGTLLNLVSNPGDASLTVDRGVNFQGKFKNGIDFTAANASFSDYLVKFNSVAGIDPNLNMSLGAFAPTNIAGYTTLTIGNLANGAFYRATDGVATGRFMAGVSSGIVMGSETAHNVSIWRGGVDRMIFGNTAISVPAGPSGSLMLFTDGSHTGRIHVSTAGGVVFGSDTNIDALFTRQGTERFRLTALNTATGIQIANTGTSYANDAAAQAGGVPVGGVYRNGSALQVRVV